MDKCVCITDSLCCISETNPTLYVNYTTIKLTTTAITKKATSEKKYSPFGLFFILNKCFFLSIHDFVTLHFGNWGKICSLDFTHHPNLMISLYNIMLKIVNDILIGEVFHYQEAASSSFPKLKVSFESSDKHHRLFFLK